MKNLAFLISQPRAGSTLTQRILAGHPSIHTVSEPWLMLAPVYALRSTGQWTEYNHALAREALGTFLGQLPRGEADYWDAVRQMYGYLYTQALHSSGKSVFLDKTPRYYYIIDELSMAFPQAKQIFLLRNPIAVLVSIYKTWCQTDWSALSLYKDDLLLAPSRLVNAIGDGRQDRIVVWYERLVDEPRSVVGLMLSYLGLQYFEGMIDYGNLQLPHWRFGDQATVYSLRRPDSDRASRWTDALRDAQMWRCARDYMEFLGRETLDKLGYSPDTLWQALDHNRPALGKRVFTRSLAYFLRV